MTLDDEGKTPHNQASIRSSMDLTRSVTFDSWLRYVDRLPAFDVDSYFSLDLRLGWYVNDDLELSVVGQNLLDSQHKEIESDFIGTEATEFERSVYAKATLYF